MSLFCIYGAGIVASSVYTAIKELYHKEPLFFLVSDPGEKGGASEYESEGLDGIPVKPLSAWEEELKNGMEGLAVPEFYLIATPETHHAVILDSLCSLKAAKIESSQIIPITNELENELMERYYHSLLGHTTVPELIAAGQRRETGAVGQQCQGEHKIPAATMESAVQVFQAKSHMDKLLHYEYLNMDYIYPIQVGAALTDQTIVNLRDDMGDNISIKNRNYCELTATYHAWKHSRADYKGICHYRRIFNISGEQMQILLGLGQEWDVILPYPTIHYPDISAQHARYVAEPDWNAMMEALQEVAPEYWEAYRESISAGERYFHNFNMLIAKAAVFDDYCSFLFRVLERTEELATPKGWERQDRFAGYMGENLTTIYFLKNRDRWKAAYAGKIWIT